MKTNEGAFVSPRAWVARPMAAVSAAVYRRMPATIRRRGLGRLCQAGEGGGTSEAHGGTDDSEFIVDYKQSWGCIHSG